MRHWNLKSGKGHYGVGYNTNNEVLIQLGEDVDYPEPGHVQIRHRFTMDEVDHLIKLLHEAKEGAPLYKARLDAAKQETENGS